MNPALSEIAVRDIEDSLLQRLALSLANSDSVGDSDWELHTGAGRVALHEVPGYTENRDDVRGYIRRVETGRAVVLVHFHKEEEGGVWGSRGFVVPGGQATSQTSPQAPSTRPAEV